MENILLIDTTVNQQVLVISKIALLTRFTDEEFVNILTVAKTDVEVEAWKIKFDATSNIDLTDVRTITGFNMLVDKGLLTRTRADEVLSTPVNPSEW